ncbi:hypothetical protein U9M48_025838 [Paspalum notatum var. saurae]|uniref:Lil3 protein n=1 Tax=Paspalum notatum var. saurae TaxID=547442 RepID=A0AAQ3WXR3_PASNO
MAMATSTFSPRPATPRPLRAGASGSHLRLLPSPRLRLRRLARAAGDAPVEVAVAVAEEQPSPAAAAASNGAASPPRRRSRPGHPRRRRSPPSGTTGGSTAPGTSPSSRRAAPSTGTPSSTPARRRKWLEDYPEATNTDQAVVFDTSIIPWWAWMKRFHLPEAEKLNGRAAMVGFFMAYFVDSLTGVGLVDQMGNFFCKTLLFVAVAGVLLIRKNEDLDNIKKIIDETTFYDKQWQATWQDDTTTGGPKN